MPSGTATLPPSTLQSFRLLSAARPFRIGNVAIDFPVVQAALSGYSDWPMRVIARRLGAAYTLGEVLLDQFIVQVSTGAKARRYIRTTERRASRRRATDGGRSGRLSARRAQTCGGRLRRDRPELRLPGEEGAGPLPGRVSLEHARRRVGDRRPGPRCLAAAHSAHGEDAPRHGRQPGEPRQLLRDLRRRLSPRRGGDHRPRPHGPAALRRPERLGLPARSEAARRPADRAGQRRPVHGRGLLEHAHPDRRRRRDGRPRRDRQPLDLPPGPGLGRRPARRASQPGRAARGHARTLSAGRGHLRPQPHLRPHAEVRHSRLADAPAGEGRPRGFRGREDPRSMARGGGEVVLMR